MTSFPSVKTDIINAGAEWVDKEVVVHNGLVTSRSPKDLAAFNRKLIEEISEGVHEPTQLQRFSISVGINMRSGSSFVESYTLLAAKEYKEFDSH